ncbi:hypothetical protein ACHAXS_013023, partial [Conticribra weissflogii]
VIFLIAIGRHCHCNCRRAGTSQRVQSPRNARSSHPPSQFGMTFSDFAQQRGGVAIIGIKGQELHGYGKGESFGPTVENFTSQSILFRFADAIIFRGRAVSNGIQALQRQCAIVYAFLLQLLLLLLLLLARGRRIRTMAIDVARSFRQFQTAHCPVGEQRRR